MSDDSDDEEEPEADRTVDRAWRATIFGLIFFPPLLHIYSLWLVGQLMSSESPLSAGKSVKLYWIVGIDVAVILAALFIGQFACMSPRFW